MFKRHYHFLVIILLAFGIQAPILLGYTDFYSGSGSDLIPYVYGTKQFQYDTFRNLYEIPLWNPYFMFGQPIVGNLQYNLFYPLNFLFLLLPFFKALWTYQFIHMVIAGIGTFMLARHTGLNRNGSMLAGCLYMLNGRLLYYINAGWVGLYTSLCWIPLLLLVSLLLLERNKRIYTIGLAITFFMIFTSGTPQHAFLYCFLFSLQAIWRFIQEPSKEERLSLLYRILLSGLISFLLISVQLFPAIEQTYLSSRVFSEGSLHGFHFNWDFRQWFRILFRPEILYHDHAWELCAYLGISGLLLAPTGFFTLRNRLPLIIIWGVIPWLISFGPDFPPITIVAKSIPGMNLLSSPSRYLIFTILILSVLSGHGFERLVVSFYSNHHPKIRYLLLLCIMLAVIGLLTPPFRTNVGVNVRFFGSIIVFFLLSALYLRHGTKFFKIILICWIIMEPLLLSTEILKEKYHLKDFKPPMKLIKALKQYPGDVRVAEIQPADLRENLLIPFDDWISVRYGIRRAGGYEPLSMLTTLNYLTRMDGTAPIKETMWGFRLWNFARPDLYSIAGITHLITFQQIENPKLKFIIQDSITMPHFHGGWWQEKKVYLYENLKVLPRAFFLADNENNFIRPVAMKILSPNRIQVGIETAHRGRVIVSESFHPGWNALIGENALTIEPFLNTFISIKIPPGNYEILLDFFPKSLRIGLWFTLAGLFLLVICLLCEKMRLGFFQAGKR
ncbi:MAG: hypothetical protein P1P89_06295 [Desulfobacterales bacterium]|nr:hypothetical protein [Desulfobacterales bacterium]